MSGLLRIAGWLVRLVAGTLIVLAVLIGILRLMLPLVPSYQEQIRQLAGDTTGLSIDFQGISASWPLSGPELRFSEVSVGLAGHEQPLLVASELRIGFSLRDLLTGRQLVPARVQASGSTLQVERLAAEGAILVNGVRLAWPLELPPATDRRLARLDLRLADIRVEISDQQRLSPRASFVLTRLDAQLAGEQLLLEAGLSLHADLGEEIELRSELPLALFGRTAMAANADWRLTLQASEIELPQWLRLALDMETPVRAGALDLQLDARLRGWQLRSLSLRPQLRNLRLQAAGESPVSWERLAAAIDWRATEDGGWQLRSGEIVVRRAGGSWPETALAVTAGPVDDKGQREFSGNMDYLRLQDLWPLLPALASRPVRAEWLPASLSGELRDWRFAARAGGEPATRFRVAGDFSELGFAMPADGMAVNGISGSISGDEQAGYLQLTSQSVNVNLPAFFAESLLAEEARGRFDWTAADGELQLRSDDMYLRTPHAEGTTQLWLKVPSAGLPQVELEASVSAARARDVLRYLPNRLPPPATRWLDQAIGEGRLDEARISWAGPLRGFPYDRTPGSFVLALDVSEATLDYAPGWPLIEDIATTVVIDGTRLWSRENSGRIGGIAFADAGIEISNLREPELEIKAVGELSATSVLGFLRASPLRENLGPVLADIEADGELDAVFELMIPLRTPRDFSLASDIDVVASRLALRTLEWPLTDLAGTVRLRGTRLYAEDFAARLLGEPVAIDLRSASADEAGYVQVAELRGVTPVSVLTEAFPLPQAERLAGTVEWAGSVAFPDREQGDEPLRIRIESPLTGLESRLPAPLAKPLRSTEWLELVAELRPDQQGLELGVSLQRDLHARLLWQQQPAGWALERGAIHAGSQPPALPSQPGFVLTGEIAELRFEDWFPGDQDPGRSMATPLPLLGNVAVRVADFGILGRRFADVQVNAVQQAGGWTIEIEAPAAAGRIVLPPDASNEVPAVLDFERLWLGQPVAEAGTVARLTDPLRTPPALITIGDFSLGELQLGRLQATARRTANGIRVTPINAGSASFRVEGSAAWLAVEGGQRTELSLTLNSSDVASTLTALGYEPVIEASRAELKLELHWAGGPGVNVAEVAAGDVSIDIRRGQLLQLEPGGGRFLGLLSVAALPKRLALDFRDVLDKGLTFDQLKGDFQLDGGNAYTCNVGLEGSVTDLALVGRAGLKDRDYDQLAVVRPHVSDVLALGSAVVGGPGVGATVLLLAQIFRKPLSALGETYYRVGGSWDEPTITRLQRSELDTAPFRDCERQLAELLPESVVPVLLPDFGNDGEGLAEDTEE